MPSKRKSTDAGASKSSSQSSKKAKVGNGSQSTSNSSSTPSAITRNARWSAVSGSANADDHYKFNTKDPAQAYEYMCICQPRWYNGDDKEEEGENEDDNDNKGDEEKKDKPQKCDGSKTCICRKPAKEHPEHSWVLSMAGHKKYIVQGIQTSLRCPDLFGMYTYNDHEAYGVIEVVENLLLDYVEAEGNWKEQWAICEALAMMLSGYLADPMMMADDSERVERLASLIVRMVLTVLAHFEAQGLLKPDSEVRNLGLVMAMYMHGTQCWQDLTFEREEDPQTGFSPGHFDKYLFSYADKYKIKLQGPPKIDEIVKDLRDIDLPDPSTNDPWGWSVAFKRYTDDYGQFVKGMTRQIGGDELDITTFTSKERKSQSFNGKDPLGRKEIQALKEGLVLQLA